MNACCPKCGAEYQLDGNLLGCKVECSVCHQKFVAGQRNNRSQISVASKCPVLFKVFAVFHILLGGFISLISAFRLEDCYGNFQWSEFVGVSVGVGLILGSSFFLVGHRIGRVFFAGGVLWGAVDVATSHNSVAENLILLTLLCFPLALSFVGKAKTWFVANENRSCNAWVQLVQNMKGLKLWIKLLVVVYIILLVLGVVTTRKHWYVNECTDDGEQIIVVTPKRETIFDKKGFCILIYPVQSTIGILPTDEEGKVIIDAEKLVRFGFDNGTGWERCKEYVRGRVASKVAKQINKYLDEVRGDL